MPPDELQRPRPRLRASAASMPRLSFRGTCVAAEMVASKPGDGVPSDAGAASTKPVKAAPPSRWQRLPPPEHQQTLVQVRVKVRASVRVGVSLAPTPILTPTLSLQRFREQLWTGPTGKKTRRRSQVHTALSLYLN